MFGNVTKVEKHDKSALVLHMEKGQPTKLVRTLTMFSFLGNSIRLRTRSTYSSNAHTFEGQDLGGVISRAEYLRTSGSNPFFDVTSVDTGTVISCEASCQDTFYGFHESTFTGPFKTLRINIHSGSPTRAVLHPITDRDGDLTEAGDPFLLLEVVVEEDQFQRLFRHLWISPTPATIRVTVSIPCFQHPAAGSALGFSEEAVLEGDKIVTAQLDGIEVEKHLARVVTNDADDPPEQTPVIIGNGEKLAAQTSESLKHIKVLVGIAVVLLMMVVLTRL